MIQWGLGQGNGFQNALATGMHMGQQARQAQDEKEYKNALAQFNPDDPETLKPIMAARPEVGLKLREDVQAKQSERELGELTQRAIGGDGAAMKQLATKNFDRWKSLDGTQREKAKQEAELFGNAALDILGRPPAQRAAAVQAYAQQLGQQYPEIAQIAALPPEQLEGKLRSAVASAGMIRELVTMERPDYMAVPYDATLVNTRDPAAVSQFGQGAPQAQGGVQEGATATNQQTGEKIIYRNGQWQPVGGGGGNVTSNFLDGL